MFGAVIMNEKFNILIKNNKSLLDKKSNDFNYVGIGKILLIIVAIINLVILAVRDVTVFRVSVFVLSLLLMIIFFVWHNKEYELLNFYKGVEAILLKSLKRLDGTWVEFKQVGGEFLDPVHPYARDLDIVGEKSLFQFLNSTHTWFGKKAFANDLLCSNYSHDEILLRQEAIQELSGEILFATESEYLLTQIGVNKADEELVLELANTSRFTRSNFIKNTLYFLPVLPIILISFGLIFDIQPVWVTGVLFAGLQMILWGFGWKKIFNYLGIMSRLPYKLSKYSEVINKITSKDFRSKKLNQIKSDLQKAQKSVKSLEKINEKISIRHNALLYFFMNIMFLWDYHCVFMLEEWKQSHGKQLESWFKTIGEYESLISFSHLPNVVKKTTKPTFSNEKIIDVKKIGHPLIKNENRVKNDLKLNNEIFIISGSNMSGKTTFLRTVGINTVLARAGSFVCAKEMNMFPFNIVSSMRVTDDLNEGISTFYAELKRIRFILSTANENTLFLIDEIFKGTNSIDRIAGAEAVIKNLSENNIPGMVSTHDLELCTLERDKIKNYSFSEYYENNNIFFSYKIEKGKAKTTNARFLMKMVGIS